MKFLNLDMHISVIQDVEHIFTALGHKVDRHSLSGHNWVDGSKKSNLRGVSNRNWTKIDAKTVTKFYKEHKKDFESYDGFVHSYPPSFAMLFEPFEKPIITVTCTRFDFPAFPENYQWLVEGLRRMSGSGQLTLTANNRLDQMYNEKFLGLETLYVSSLCNYMNQKTEARAGDFLFWSRYHSTPGIKGLNQDFSILKNYDRNSIRNFSGVVHLPYNLSIMSAFEHYWQNIPLYFPSVEFQSELYASNEGSLEEVLFEKTSLYFDKSMIELADWYDQENFAGVRLFNSWADLEQMLANDDLTSIQQEMALNNRSRKTRIYSSWESILEAV